jgi:hypothetical protein
MSLLKAQPLQFDQTWQVLSQEVSRLITDFSCGMRNELFIQLHTYIYKLCTIPQGHMRKPLADRLYFSLKDLLEDFCDKLANDLLNSPCILQLYSSLWHRYCIGMQYVDRCASYPMFSPCRKLKQRAASTNEFAAKHALQQHH